MVAVEKRTCVHALFSTELQLANFQPLVGAGDEEPTFLFTDFTRPTAICGLPGLLRLYDFQGIAVAEFCPCAGIRTEATNKVVNLLCRLVPVDPACLLENLWSRFEFGSCLTDDLTLVDALNVAVGSQYLVHSLYAKCRRLTSSVRRRHIPRWHHRVWGNAFAR